MIAGLASIRYSKGLNLNRSKGAATFPSRSSTCTQRRNATGALADAVGATAQAELAKSRKRKTAKPWGAREGNETAIRAVRVVFDLRPDLDSNAGPTA
jgi:hypothetical protein